MLCGSPFGAVLNGSQVSIFSGGGARGGTPGEQIRRGAGGGKGGNSGGGGLFKKKKTSVGRDGSAARSQSTDREASRECHVRVGGREDRRWRDIQRHTQTAAQVADGIGRERRRLT